LRHRTQGSGSANPRLLCVAALKPQFLFLCTHNRYSLFSFLALLPPCLQLSGKPPSFPLFGYALLSHGFVSRHLIGKWTTTPSPLRACVRPFENYASRLVGQELLLMHVLRFPSCGGEELSFVDFCAGHCPPPPSRFFFSGWNVLPIPCVLQVIVHFQRVFSRIWLSPFGPRSWIPPPSTVSACMSNPFLSAGCPFHSHAQSIYGISYFLIISVIFLTQEIELYPPAFLEIDFVTFFYLRNTSLPVAVPIDFGIFPFLNKG